jgi:hypothetical protein
MECGCPPPPPTFQPGLPFRQTRQKAHPTVGRVGTAQWRRRRITPFSPLHRVAFSARVGVSWRACCRRERHALCIPRSEATRRESNHAAAEAWTEKRACCPQARAADPDRARCNVLPRSPRAASLRWTGGDEARPVPPGSRVRPPNRHGGPPCAPRASPRPSMRRGGAGVPLRRRAALAPGPDWTASGSMSLRRRGPRGGTRLACARAWPWGVRPAGSRLAHASTSPAAPRLEVPRPPAPITLTPTPQGPPQTLLRRLSPVH